MATKTETTERIVKAGGKKGEAIVELLRKEPGLTRAQVADKVGATVGRVGEVVRFLAGHGDADQKAVIAKHVASQPPRKVAEKKATPTKAAPKTAAKKTTARKPAGASRKAARAKKDTAKKV